jgi:hypothetical protein
MISNENKHVGEPSDNSWDLLFIVGAPIISFFLVTMVSQPRLNGDRFLFDP